MINLNFLKSGDGTKQFWGDEFGRESKGYINEVRTSRAAATASGRCNASTVFAIVLGLVIIGGFMGHKTATAWKEKKKMCNS